VSRVIAMLPLEDLFNDVISKAQRGLGLSDDALARNAGISVTNLQVVKSGAVDENILRQLAAPLDLHAPSLITMARNAWRPRPVALEGLAQFNTPYHDMTVNAYVVWDPATRQAAAFDTGADAQPMLDFIKLYALKLSHIFITHTHPDHVLDLEKLRAATGCSAVFSHTREPWSGTTIFEIGKDSSWSLGALRIEARSTCGHSKGGVTYVVHGLKQPVAVVGDALFSSSMGGGMVSYADALATNRKEIFSLPDDTVVCPGHGPLTTVGEEKKNNPFYPEFK
jgi:glyoxylase-like metal-dependent hydrolase (beta-lactamase superfamily II)